MAAKEPLNDQLTEMVFSTMIDHDAVHPTCVWKVCPHGSQGAPDEKHPCPEGHQCELFGRQHQTWKYLTDMASELTMFEAISYYNKLQ